MTCHSLSTARMLSSTYWTSWAQKKKFSVRRSTAKKYGLCQLPIKNLAAKWRPRVITSYLRLSWIGLSFRKKKNQVFLDLAMHAFMQKVCKSLTRLSLYLWRKIHSLAGYVSCNRSHCLAFLLRAASSKPSLSWYKLHAFVLWSVSEFFRGLSPSSKRNSVFLWSNKYNPGPFSLPPSTLLQIRIDEVSHAFAGRNDLSFEAPAAPCVRKGASQCHILDVRIIDRPTARGRIWFSRAFVHNATLLIAP